MLTRV